MLRRSHRRRPPIPTWLAVVLFVVAVAAVVAAGVIRDPWLLRGSVAALLAVAVVNSWLLVRMRRMLRQAQIEAAGMSTALARAEGRASRELLRRDHEIARLDDELAVASARLVEVTGASLYAATVLAELFRNNQYLSDTDDEHSVTDEGNATSEGEEDATEDSALKSANSTVVQVWPSVDDAPTVVDMLRWDQIRRLAEGPAAEESAVDERRPA